MYRKRTVIWPFYFYTIIRTLSYEASQMVADQMGFPYDKELYLKYLGVSDEEVWANYHQIFASFGKNNVQKFINDAYEETIRRFSLGAVQLKPGVIELLDFLEEHRIPKVVASSNQRHIIELLLEKNQLTNYFETIVSAENVKRAKPDPEIFLLAHEYLGTKKQETLVLEDSKNGILAAASAEIPVIMIPDLLAPSEDLQQKTLAVLSSLHEVPGYLKK
ncbi:HAD family hydrolase [Enterococcus hirae]|nr:HAD family hydrolase [Enterococcus hirae]